MIVLRAPNVAAGVDILQRKPWNVSVLTPNGWKPYTDWQTVECGEKEKISPEMPKKAKYHPNISRKPHIVPRIKTPPHVFSRTYSVKVYIIQYTHV